MLWMNRKIKHARAAKLFRALYLLFPLSKLIKLIKFEPTFDLKNTPKILKNNAFFTKWSGADLLLPLVGRPQNPRCIPAKQWIWLDLRKRSNSKPEITCFKRKTCENM